MASQSLQDPYLNILRKERIPVSIFLMNGIKLQGHIESFDQFVVLLKNNTSQMIYKHAISTIVPSQPVKMHRDLPLKNAPVYGDNDSEVPASSTAPATTTAEKTEGEL